jgi:hypothetical protein
MPLDHPTYRETVSQLALALRRYGPKDELRIRVARLFSEKFSELIVVVFDEPPAGTTKYGIVIYPSDCLLRLLAAVRADDSDGVMALEHELLSLGSVGAA